MAVIKARVDSRGMTVSGEGTGAFEQVETGAVGIPSDRHWLNNPRI